MPGALRNVLTFVLQLFQKYGFLLNLEKGKTSAVVSFRGTGAPLLRQRYQLGPCPGETVQIADQTIFLHYVPSYKHLGTIFAANHRVDLDTKPYWPSSSGFQPSCKAHLEQSPSPRMHPCPVISGLDWDEIVFWVWCLAHSNAQTDG